MSANDVIAEIEVMKMYIPITVPEKGTIRLMKQAGCNVEVGEIIGTPSSHILAILKLEEPSLVRRVTDYKGVFSEFFATLLCQQGEEEPALAKDTAHP